MSKGDKFLFFVWIKVLYILEEGCIEDLCEEGNIDFIEFSLFVIGECE